MRTLSKSHVLVEIRTTGVFPVHVRGLCSDQLQLGVVSSCFSSSSGLQTTTRALPRGHWSGCKPLHIWRKKFSCTKFVHITRYGVGLAWVFGDSAGRLSCVTFLAVLNRGKIIMEYISLLTLLYTTYVPTDRSVDWIKLKYTDFKTIRGLKGWGFPGINFCSYWQHFSSFEPNNSVVVYRPKQLINVCEPIHSEHNIIKTSYRLLMLCHTLFATNRNFFAVFATHTWFKPQWALFTSASPTPRGS